MRRLLTVPIFRLTKPLLLSTVLLSLSLIGFRIGSYPQMLHLPGAKSLLFEAVTLLLAYLLVILLVARRRFVGSLATSTKIGIVGAILQTSHLLVERFVSFSGWLDPSVTLTFMIVTFLLWGMTGFRAATVGETLTTGVRLSAWSALVTMTVAIAFGIALDLYLAPIPPDSMLAWPEFQRTGWTDIQAFAIANTLDSASSHLLIGPIMGGLSGGAGYLLCRQRIRVPVSEII